MNTERMQCERARNSQSPPAARSHDPLAAAVSALLEPTVIRLACATCCLWDWPLDKTLAAYEELGFTAIELLALGADQHLDVMQCEASRLRSLIARHGLELAAIYPKPVNTMTEKDRAESMEYVRRTIDLACELGCRRIVFTPIHFPREKIDYSKIAAACGELAAYVGNRDVVICLENHHGFPLSVAEDYEKVFSLIDDHRIGITVDTGHFTASRVDVPGFVDRWRQRIYHVHLKDQVGTKPVPFGAGQTDNVTAVERLRAIGFDGYASIELEIEHKQRRLEQLADARRYCTMLLNVT